MDKLRTHISNIGWLWSPLGFVVTVGGGVLLTWITAAFSPVWNNFGLGGVLIVLVWAIAGLFALRHYCFHGYSMFPKKVMFAVTRDRKLLSEAVKDGAPYSHISVRDGDSRVRVTIFLRERMKIRTAHACYAGTRKPLEFEEITRNCEGIILDFADITPDEMVEIVIEPSWNIYD